jgi:hypothetical protein
MTDAARVTSTAQLVGWRVRNPTQFRAISNAGEAGGTRRPLLASPEPDLLTQRGQAILFKAIRSGACKNYKNLRVTVNALGQVEAQFDAMPHEPLPPSGGRPPAPVSVKHDVRSNRRFSDGPTGWLPRLR